MSGVHRWRATERPGDGAVVEVVDAADHDRIVSALTEGGRKMQAERDQLAERCRELEHQATGDLLDRLLAQINASVAINYHGAVFEVDIGSEELDAVVTLQRRGHPSAHDLRMKAEQERDTLRAEVEALRQDAERINKLAAQARMIYGHKSEASYQPGELPELIHSSREECRPDDLRRAIDAAMEASR